VEDDILPLPEPPLSEETLLLRPWEERDAGVVLAAGPDQLISRYRYSLPRTPEGAHAWIAATRTDRLASTRLELAITDRSMPVGSVSLTDFNHGNACSATGCSQRAAAVVWPPAQPGC
jgi:RimJ/RimL family protein N-acetyltransferase